MPADLCLLILEFARAQQTADPYAFQQVPQEYLLREPGGTFATAQFAWDAELLSELAALRRPSCDPALLQRVGNKLRRFVLPLGWAELETQIHAAREAHRPVQLTIRSAAAELYALPWELLTLGTTGQHLGELPGVMLHYEWPTSGGPAAAEAAALPEGGRILFAWSAAAGGVPAAEHLGAIERACQDASYPFDAQRDVLANVSYAGLEARLAAAQAEQRPIAVLQLLCHGAAAGSTFGLAWDSGDAGGLVVIDAGRLRQLLAPYAATLRLVVLCACDSGNLGALGNQLGSVAQTLHRAGIAAVVASRYPLSGVGSLRLTQALYGELLANTASLQEALRVARQRLAAETTTLDWAGLQLYAHAQDAEDTRPFVFRPYRGLLAFQPEHRRFFFGRDAEIAQVVQDLGALRAVGRPRFLIVAGASGSGKSSLVLAGAVPQLLSASPQQLVRVRPGDHDSMDGLGKTAGTTRLPVLMVVDQLEELFTHVADPDARQQWLRRLWQLASEKSGDVTIILTLRVDFIGRCGEILLAPGGPRLDTVAYDEAHRVFVAQLGPAALAQVITKPAERVGLRLEEGLVQRMLRDIGEEPGALPLLEHTLDLLWLRRHRCTLTQAGYDAVGGVAGALHGRAEELLASLAAAEQAMARRVVVRLVQVGDDPTQSTRRRVEVAKLRPSSAANAVRFDQVLAALVTARLLVCSGEGAKQTVEIAHEALIRKWPRLIDWVRDDRQLLTVGPSGTDGVGLWNIGDGTLVRTLLPPLTEPTNTEPPDLDVPFTYTGAALSLDGNRVISEGRCPAVIWDAHSGNRRWDGKRDQQGQYCRSTYYPQGDRVLLHFYQAANYGVVQVYDAAQGKLLTDEGSDSGAIAAVLSADGTQLSTLLRSGGVALWHLGPRNLQIPLVENLGTTRAAAFSADGRYLATGNTAGLTRLWDAGTGQLQQSMLGAASPVAFSPDGKLLAIERAEDQVALFSTELHDTLPGLAGAHQVAAPAKAARRDGRRAANRQLEKAGEDSAAFLYQLPGHQLLATLRHKGALNFEAALTRDGAFIVTWDFGKSGEDEPMAPVASAAVWDGATGQLLLTVPGEAAALIVDSLGLDGQSVSTATGQRWELTASPPNNAELESFIACQIPLRFDGETVIPSDVKKTCPAAGKPD